MLLKQARRLYAHLQTWIAFLKAMAPLTIRAKAVPWYKCPFSRPSLLQANSFINVSPNYQLHQSSIAASLASSVRKVPTGCQPTLKRPEREGQEQGGAAASSCSSLTCHSQIPMKINSIGYFHSMCLQSNVVVGRANTGSFLNRWEALLAEFAAHFR